MTKNLLILIRTQKIFLHRHCEPKAKQSLNIGIASGFRPRNDNLVNAFVLIAIFLLIGVFGVSYSEGDLRGSIQIKGSDTMVNLGQALAEAFMERYPEVFIAVTGGGSGTGIASLISGTCDIAMSSREMKQSETELAFSKGREPCEFLVARDGLSVVVHPENPVTKLTLEELSDIFTGKVKNWKELKGLDQKIVILSREVNSGTHVYFKEHVLRKGNPEAKEEFSPDSLLMSSSQAIAEEVAGNPQAIGYYGMGYLSSRQKAIAVSRDRDGPYIEPKIENVVSEIYPISRPLYFYTKNKPEGLIKEFLDFVLGEEGQELVKLTDFVPITLKR